MKNLYFSNGYAYNKLGRILLTEEEIVIDSLLITNQHRVLNKPKAFFYQLTPPFFNKKKQSYPQSKTGKTILSFLSCSILVQILRITVSKERKVSEKMDARIMYLFDFYIYLMVSN